MNIHLKPYSGVVLALTLSAVAVFESSIPVNAGPIGRSALRGAIAGAVIGEISSGEPAKGAAIGAGVGAVVGAIKKNNQRDRIRHRAGRRPKVKHRR